ncbi:hypothetical protein SDC9_208539 [bioreactor metagenome]|uniref:Uncharacterized protein n=1 Tax=bioreactor metagenome TaxID=1076179 RepID=A0A645JBU7_9ZZZZ
MHRADRLRILVVTAYERLAVVPQIRHIHDLVHQALFRAENRS